MNVRLFILILMVFFSGATSASADGMPFQPAKAEPVLPPLDKPLNNIQPAQSQLPAQPLVQPPVEAAQPAPLLPPEPPSRVVEVQPNASFFGLSVGMYDPFTHHTGGTSLNAEWQPGVRIAGILQPLFGAIVTTRGSLLGYGGIGVPFHVAEHVMMLPSIAVGAYSRGDGYDLHHTLVYRGGTELAYEFDDQSRIGLNLHILSGGGSLSQKDRTEVIGLAYTVPMSMLSKSTIPPSTQAHTPYND